MRAIDYMFALFVGAVAAWVMWLILCVPMVIIHMIGLAPAYPPIWGWPLWAAGGVGLTLFAMVVVVDLAFHRS